MSGAFSILGFAILRAGDASAGVDFVPPIMRRRLSPLQKIFFSLAHAVEVAPSAATVFASRDGEDALTRRIVADFNDDGSVSPQRFSASVYNAAPGLWSVFTKNRAPYTATASGADSLECGLLETLFAARPALFVYAEETGGGYGSAVVLGEPSEGARTVRVASGNPSRQPVAFEDFAAFLEGRIPALEGRWIALS